MRRTNRLAAVLGSMSRCFHHSLNRIAAAPRRGAGHALEPLEPRSLLSVPTVDIIDISPDPRNTSVSTATITFSEAVAGFDIADLALTRNGGSNLLTGSQTLATTNNVVFTLTGLASLTGTTGVYSLTLNSATAGVTSVSTADALAQDASDTWTVDATAPTVDITDVTPDPRNTSVSSINFVFSEAVTGFNLADLSLTRAGGSNLLTASQTLTTTDNITFTLGNLGSLTTPAGAYTLTLTATGAGIADALGNSLTASATDTFTVDLTAPTADIVNVTPDPRSTQTNSITITFTEAVDGFDKADLTLTRDGVAVPLTDDQTLTTSDNITFTLGNLGALTTTSGAYRLKLTASGSTIKDKAGNAMTADATDDWVVDSIAPTADVVDVAPDPRQTGVDTLTLNFSEQITGLTLSDFTLTRDGGPNLLTGSQTISQASSTSWTLGNLISLTSTTGVYTITLVASGSGISDGVGNLLSVDAGDTFTVTVDPVNPTADIVPVTPDPRSTAVSTIVVLFSEAVAGLSLSDFTLTRAGSNTNLLTDNQTLFSTDNIVWTIGNLAAVTNTSGVYTLALKPNAGVTDSNNNPLVSTPSETFTIDTAAPTADVTDVAPDPRQQNVDTVTVVFSEAVTGVDITDFRLSRSGGANLLTDAQTVTTSDNITYTISNLGALTTATGSYTLTLVAANSGITDAVGNLFAANAADTFAVDASGPVANILDVDPDARNSGVDSIQILFNEPVANFDLADLSLTRDGGANLLTSAVTLETTNQILFTLNGLKKLTATAGTYTLTLTAAGSGITDTLGNAISVNATDSFLVAPKTTLPAFGDPVANQILPVDGTILMIPVDGKVVSPAGVVDETAPLTISATSDDPNVEVSVPTGNVFAKLHFKQSNLAPLGDIVVELFNNHTASAQAISRFVNLSTGKVTDNIKAMAIGPDGTIWVVQNSLGFDVLATVDPATGVVGYRGTANTAAAAQIKVSNVGTNITAMDFDSSGELYGISDPAGAGNASIVKINRTNPGSSTVLANATVGTVTEGLAGFSADISNKFLSIGTSTNPDKLLISTSSGSPADIRPAVSLGDLSDGLNIKAVTVAPNGKTYALVAPAADDNTTPYKIYEVTRGNSGLVTGFNFVGDLRDPTGGRVSNILAMDWSSSESRLRFVGIDPTLSATQQQIFRVDPTAPVSGVLTATPTASLVTGASPFYSNVKVHRVVPDFVIQTGDFAKGDGTGGSQMGPFNDNFDPQLTFAGPGVLAYANSGANSSDTQFFITELANTLNNSGTNGAFLGKYMVFGQMISGQDIFQNIINRTTKGGTGADKERPNDPPLLQSVEIFQSVQDGVVEVRKKDGSTWDGEAEVTLKLQDAQGHVTERKVAVYAKDKLGARPVIPTIPNQSFTPGSSTVFDPRITDDSGIPLVYSVATSFKVQDPRTGAFKDIATVDPQTGKITLNIPQDFSGQFAVTLTAMEKGFDKDLFAPATSTFFVNAQKEVDPDIIARGSINANGTAFATQIVGNRLYVAAGTNGLEVYDITDPTKPVLLGSKDTTGTAIDVQVVGTTAFVADLTGGIVLLDVSTPGSIPAAVATLTPTGTASTAGKSTAGFAFSPANANILYAAEGGLGLAIYDITNRSNVVKLGSLKNLLGKFGSSSYEPGAVDVVIRQEKDSTGTLRDKYAIISDNRANVVEILDISNPASPQFVNLVVPGGSPWGIDVVGDVLYVTDRLKGVSLFNIANPAKPKSLGRLKLDGNPWQLTVSGQRALVAVEDGYAILDVTNPRKPRQVGKMIGLAQGYRAAVTADGTIATPAGSFGYWIAKGNVSQVTRSQTFVDSQGVPVTVTLTGGGTLNVTTTGFATGDIQSIQVVGSTASTSVTVTTPKGTTSTLGSVAADGPMRAFNAPSINLSGDFTVAGTLSKLVLRNTTGDKTITIGGPTGNAKAPRLDITLSAATNTSIQSAIPIASLTAASWADTDANIDLIAAPTLGVLKVAGAFSPNVTLSGGTGALTLGGAAVGGAVTGDWAVTGNAGILALGSTTQAFSLAVSGSVASVKSAGALSGAFTAASLAAIAAASADHLNVTTTGSTASATFTGVVADSTFRSGGDINSFRAGALSSSRILVAVDDAVASVPITKGDFAAFDDDADTTPDASKLKALKSLTITGVPGSPAAASFIDSTVAAWKLGKISLKIVETDNSVGNNPHGIVGDTLASYSRVAPNGATIKPTIGAAPTTVEEFDDYSVKLV